MSTRQKEIADLQASLEGVADKEQRQVLLNKLAALAAAELAERKNAPPYPVGLTASFGGKVVRITKAWQAGGAWMFTVDAKLGMLFGLGDGMHDLTEAELRGHLESALGVMAPTQLYPVGIYLMCCGNGGVITGVSQDSTGRFCYTLKGWPQQVTQVDLQAMLRG